LLVSKTNNAKAFLQNQNGTNTTGFQSDLQFAMSEDESIILGRWT
jgi:hypothetical protein